MKNFNSYILTYPGSDFHTLTNKAGILNILSNGNNNKMIKNISSINLLILCLYGFSDNVMFLLKWSGETYGYNNRNLYTQYGPRDFHKQSSEVFL